MSRRTKYTAKEKYEILDDYKNENGTLHKIATKYKITVMTLKKWEYNYSKHGIDGLRESKTWKRYSKQLKELAVKDYISGKFSQSEIVRRNGISNTSLLQKWINKYNGHRELKATMKGMSHSMIKGRITSWKERIEIALYCIAENNNYQHACKVYNVSYQQVYQWVKKYESGSENALKDRRGIKKPEEDLTLEDKTKLSIKKLEIENKRLRVENVFLKKLEELERGCS